MNVLIGCEHSGIIREAFRSLGHKAYSCDLLPSEIPSEFHIQDDILDVIKIPWIRVDLFIAHPPCTYLSVAGNGAYSEERKIKIEEAKEFFLKLYRAPFRHICIENPVGLLNTKYRPTQVIQPYFFGDASHKRTCLWLKNLPLLKQTNFVKPVIGGVFKSGPKKGKNYNWTDKIGGRNRAQLRSKTFPGIAAAMSLQWSGVDEQKFRDALGRAV